MPDASLRHASESGQVATNQIHTGNPSPNVLILDPDGGVCRVVSLMLKEVGAVSVCANDGVTALQLAEQHHPDLIIAETRLPDMTGTEFARRLRDLGHADARVILMSVYPRPPIGAEDHFLQKPLRFERLLEIARECVH